MPAGRPKGSVATPVSFEVVTPDEVEAIKALPVWVSQRLGSPLYRALFNGDVVFLPGKTPSQANANGALARLRKQGFRTHVRPLTRDGVEGTAAWAEPQGSVDRQTPKAAK